jgi:hypothetical protein
MFKTFIAASVVTLTLISGALADEGEQPLQPVISDDVAVNPGTPDDQPIEAGLDDDVAVNPGQPDDQPIDPSYSDDSEVNLPPVEPQSTAALVIRVPLRADGTPPDVRLERAGRDAELWVDGVKRVVLKGRGRLTTDDLALVFG